MTAHDDDLEARVGLAGVVEAGTWSIHRAVELLGAPRVWADLRCGRRPTGVGPTLADAARRRAEAHDPGRALR
nr:hypothetical protein [Actinomycetota bacterium]